MSETLLVIDAGNTRIKAACYENGQIESQYNWSLDEARARLENLASAFKPSKCMVSSTRGLSFSLQDIFPETALFELIPQQTSGLTLAYAQPETLGKDRLAAMLGALNLFPSEALCIADAGTCLTLDFVLPGGKHLGGFISPGLTMRLQAMHQGTANLPLALPRQAGSFLGTDTLSCIAGGAVWGMVSEIQNHLQTLFDTYSMPFKLILTGGDANFLAQRFKHPTFVIPDLVFRGLYVASTNPA